METVSFMWTIVIIGISTVFLCLLSLVAMVGFFKFIFVRSPKKSTTIVASLAQAAPAAASVKAGGVDGSVIAAIVAAIAAASGSPASSIRIASLERSGFNTPVWGYADRVASSGTNGRA
jgi:Na+-transporting methylmalonyl-CoA/oxaloacetate decarboxylase gamma subunit